MCKKIILMAVFLSFGALMSAPYAIAQSDPKAVFNSSGLPIPRFVSLRSNKVFVRTGPALRYPIKWVFVQAGMPIEIIQEFDTWRKIRDIEGEEGWIHQSLLSGRRNAIITAEDGLVIYRKTSAEAKPVALLEKGVQVSLEECLADWCRVDAGDFSGWAEKKSLYGVYASEELD